jgi:hypothetical protein
MKSNKEILELMLENQHLFKAGLCQWAFDTCIKNNISMKEYDNIDWYIYKNRPMNLRTLFNTTYYWYPRDKSPRIKWIKKHIKKLSV